MSNIPQNPKQGNISSDQKSKDARKDAPDATRRGGMLNEPETKSPRSDESRSSTKKDY